MKLEELTSEMLTEIKDLKDLTKQELPLIVKEYIRAEKVVATIGLAIGGAFFLVSAFLIYKGVTFIERNNYSHDAFGWYASAAVTLFAAFLFTLINGLNLLAVVMQPRRTAIKAITSLKE
jgi:hypothetical protein